MDIARLLQYLNNISDRFRNILAILQYFQGIFLQHFLNISGMGNVFYLNQNLSNKFLSQYNQSNEICRAFVISVTRNKSRGEYGRSYETLDSRIYKIRLTYSYSISRTRVSHGVDRRVLTFQQKKRKKEHIVGSVASNLLPRLPWRSLDVPASWNIPIHILMHICTYIHTIENSD